MVQKTAALHQRACYEAQRQILTPVRRYDPVTATPGRAATSGGSVGGMAWEEPLYPAEELRGACMPMH